VFDFNSFFQSNIVLHVFPGNESTKGQCILFSSSFFSFFPYRVLAKCLAELKFIAYLILAKRFGSKTFGAVCHKKANQMTFHFLILLIHKMETILN